MLLLLSDPVFFTLTCGALGLIIGSFINVVNVRLPRMMESQWHKDCCELMDQPIPADTPAGIKSAGPNSNNNRPSGAKIKISSFSGCVFFAGIIAS